MDSKIQCFCEWKDNKIPEKPTIENDKKWVRDIVKEVTRECDAYSELKGIIDTRTRGQILVMLPRFGYILKFDIRKYFDSIDHKILKRKLAPWGIRLAV